MVVAVPAFPSLILLSPAVAVKVRAASARVFVEWPNSKNSPQQLALSCGTLISARFVVTASHILPETGNAKVWVLLGQQTCLRAATVYKRMCAKKEDVTLLQLERSVTDVEPLGLPLTPPSQLQSMAMVGFHPPLEKEPNNIVSVVHVGTGGDLRLESNQPLRQAQIEALAHSSFDPTDGVAIERSVHCHATQLSPAVCRPLFDSLLLCIYAQVPMFWRNIGLSCGGRAQRTRGRRAHADAVA